MQPETDSTDPNLDRALYGRLLGIIQDREKLNALSDSLTQSETGQLEIMQGPKGIGTLEKWKEDSDQFFFSDMEGEMLQRYLEAANENLVVFSIVVKSSDANEVAEMAKSSGAVEVVHFGNSAVTHY